MRKVDAAFVVDFDDFDGQLVADLHDVFDFLDTVLCKLRDMAETFLVRQDLDEGAELEDARDRACEDFANLDVADDVANHLLGFCHAFGIV